MRETIGYKPKVANWIQEQIKHGKVYLISWSILLEDAAFAKPSGRLESFGWGSLDHLPLLEPGKGNYFFSFHFVIYRRRNFTQKNPNPYNYNHTTNFVGSNVGLQDRIARLDI